MKAVVGLVAAAVVGVALAAGGCKNLPRTGELQSEEGKKITLDQTPPEVVDLVRASHPGAEIEKVVERTHSERVRNFEVHLRTPEGRKKVVEFNTFPRRSQEVQELGQQELKGVGYEQPRK